MAFDGLMHLVDGVVHRRDEIADVAAVERRDEGAAHGEQRLAGDIIGGVLLPADFLTAGEIALPAVEHSAQRMGARDQRFRMALEQIEEALFARQQRLKPRQHPRPSRLS